MLHPNHNTIPNPIHSLEVSRFLYEVRFLNYQEPVPVLYPQSAHSNKHFAAVNANRANVWDWELYYDLDEVTNGDNSEAMLANAPKAKEGQYQVPKTIG